MNEGLNATEQVIADVEAQRSLTANVKLEGGLSVKDWVDRIAGSTREAAKLARQENAQLEYEAWIEATAIMVGRAEQALRATVALACDHEWPAELEHHSECARCGMLYGDFSDD